MGTPWSHAAQIREVVKGFPKYFCRISQPSHFVPCTCKCTERKLLNVKHILYGTYLLSTTVTKWKHSSTVQEHTLELLNAYFAICLRTSASGPFAGCWGPLDLWTAFCWVISDFSKEEQATVSLPWQPSVCITTEQTVEQVCDMIMYHVHVNIALTCSVMCIMVRGGGKLFITCTSWNYYQSVSPVIVSNDQ